MLKLFKRFLFFIKVSFYLFDYSSVFINLEFLSLLEQIKIVGPSSLFIVIVTSFFISLVFSIQVVKEFLYLNFVDLVGSILALTFIRELSPVLTSIILIGKVGSYFTSELATMVVTEQVDALYLLGISPVNYLIMPRVISVLFLLPFLNFFSILTSLISSSFICFILYNIHPHSFLMSAYSSFSYLDLFKSCLKTVVFGWFISIISCVWGLTTTGGSKGVGKSTTASVVVSLLLVFILDFILSFFMFDSSESLLQVL
uniref:ABC transporter permease n=1 Tax=Bostrychia moritziana TaxID=103713 RepID=A0A1Z1M759_BOSMO|nr:hypothetical protein [Bostrychia moritziana]ARW61595.1 hypothetical protein [Bostrychia moritziana]